MSCSSLSLGSRIIGLRGSSIRLGTEPTRPLALATEEEIRNDNPDQKMMESKFQLRFNFSL